MSRSRPLLVVGVCVVCILGLLLPAFADEEKGYDKTCHGGKKKAAVGVSSDHEVYLISESARFVAEVLLDPLPEGMTVAGYFYDGTKGGDDDDDDDDDDENKKKKRRSTR